MRSFSSSSALLISSGLLALAASCGGTVLLGPDGTTTSSETNSTGTGGETTTSTTSTTTTSTTTSTSTTKPVMCGETHDAFKATLERPDGSVVGCYIAGQTLPYELVLQATVLEADGNLIVLDTCGPDADCAGPIVNRLVVDSPGFHASIPPGAYVELRFELESAWAGCIHRVTVQNMPSWAGLPNPVSDDRLWLAGSEGYQGSMTGAPFYAAAEPLGCNYPDAGCALHEDYQWHVSSASDPTGVYVPMGATTTWFDDTAPYLVRNLKSFSSGWCDDYWNWAFWITHMEPPI